MAAHLYRKVRSNTLLESCASLIALTTKFKDLDRGKSIPSTFRTMIFVAFDEFERKAFDNKISMKIVSESKFALAVFIDETVLTSLWPGRMQWMSNPLQVKYFGEHLGGELFYKKLKKFRVMGEHYLNLVELYYVCLQLGFEGMYRLGGDDKLMMLQVDLKSQLETGRDDLSSEISPSGLPRNNLVTKISNEFPYWVIISITLSIMFVTYLSYKSLINSYSENAIYEIDKENKNIADLRIKNNGSRVK